MAEYVRRRRPPASHPYWQHLHDRAHPPPLITPILVPGTLGGALGLWAGQSPECSLSATLRSAIEIVGLLAFVLGAVFGTRLAIDRESRRFWQRSKDILSAVLTFSVVIFFLAIMPVSVIVLCYQLCSGLGWLGAVVGAVMWGTPGAFVAIVSRRRWSQRVRDWPRWGSSRDRRYRRQARRAEATQPTSASTDPQVDSPITIVRRDFNPRSE